MDGVVDEILHCLPADTRNLPGTVLYSGRNSWAGRAQVYLLGFNPGGTSESVQTTVADSVRYAIGHKKADYNRYVDDRWATRAGRLYEAGEHPMQVRVRDLFGLLKIPLGSVPTSNLIFAHSRQAAHLSDPQSLAAACWPFHAEMIKRLQPTVVVCIGKETGAFVTARVEGPEVVKVRHTSRSARTWGHDAAPLVQAALDKANNRSPTKPS